MIFSITGVNHKSAPVEVREKLAFDATALSGALANLKQRPGIAESMILSTCNRLEVSLACEEAAGSVNAVEQFLADTKNVDPVWIRNYLYRYQDRDAIRHLFRVAASLDSMVVGEPQILGQLKNAFAVAKDQGAVNTYLDTVVTRAFSVAKRVRTETEIGSSAVSVSYAAVDMAREIFGSLHNRKVMLIGAGKMSESAARHLSRSGVSSIYVTNRTRSRAEEMAKLFNGRIVEYDQYLTVLPEVEIVITSSGATHFLLTKNDVRKIIEARKNKPMFLIDIAVPRNIDPAVNELDNVFLYDIDDLQKVVESNLRGRMQEAESAERIVSEEVERLVSRLKTREVVPMIVSLQEQLEHLRQGEVARYYGKLNGLTKDQQEAVDQLTRSIINKVAHGPISELRKQASQPDGHHFVSAIRKVFRLGD